MPKRVKTHKATAKRLWKSGAGKLMRRRAGRSHHQGRKAKRQLLRRGASVAAPVSNPRVAELIPYL